MKKPKEINSLIALEAFDALLDISKLLEKRVTKLETAVKTLRLQQRPFRKMGKGEAIVYDR